MVPWYVWAGFIAVLVLFLALDLGLHARAKRIPMREAVLWTLGWVAVALAFGCLLWWWRGDQMAGEFIAGYVIEWSLSVDNVFVFFLIMAYLTIPDAFQHRVLFYGVIGAVLMRLGFILGGAALIHRFEWMTLVFGAVLLASAVRLAREQEGARSVEDNPIFRLIRRVIPITSQHEGEALLTRSGGRLAATPLLGAVILVNVTDVVFAVDSIPAVFSVTRDPFVAFTSNALAILGLRSLYFVVAGGIGSFRYLRPALAAVLAFVAIKMVLSPWLALPIAPSLGVIVAILGLGIGASWFLPSISRAVGAARSGTREAWAPTIVTILLVSAVLTVSVLMILAFEFFL